MHQVILHRGEFFKQYREFWRDPSSQRVRESWIALLFSVLCLSLVLSHGNVFGSAGTLERSSGVGFDLKRLDPFREKTVQALILSNYTKGGPHIIETLLHHILGEMFIRRDCVSRRCKSIILAMLTSPLQGRRYLDCTWKPGSNRYVIEEHAHEKCAIANADVSC
jgi:hypothetical protein